MDIINNLIDIELFRVGKYSVTFGIILNCFIYNYHYKVIVVDNKENM